MGWTVLHTAARDGDMKRIKRCIEDVKWLDKIDVNSQSASLSVCKSLLTHSLQVLMHLFSHYLPRSGTARPHGTAHVCSKWTRRGHAGASFRKQFRTLWFFFSRFFETPPFSSF
jgi:hypothetical protein